MDEIKYNKTVNFWALLLGILQGITTILSVLSGNIFTIIGAITAVILIMLFVSFSKKLSMIGPIIGIILGVFYISSLDIISLLIGIFLILDSVKFLKYIKNNPR